MKAVGHTSVMAARAPATVEADDPLAALYRQLEFFPTAPWGGRAGGELVRLIDPDARSVWEPACGQGHMASPLAEQFGVFASDIHPFGYGATIDFLADDAEIPIGEADWIITNPPFQTAVDFVRLGLARARRGVAILQRLQFIETPERYRLIHEGPHPMTTCAPFAERLPMTLGRWDPKASSATGYAWFVWMKGAAPRPMMGIPPGTKKRLTRPDDAARWGVRKPAGLLEAMEGANG